MNDEEVVDLIDLALAFNPSLPMTPATPEAWLSVLADVPLAAAKAAVREHFAMGERWIAPGDVRRRVAEALGVVPPDVETAYAQAVAFRTWLDDRHGHEPKTHPAALAAARTIGWDAFGGSAGLARNRFAAAYATAHAAAVRQVATGDLRLLAQQVAGSKARPVGRLPAAPDDTFATGPADTRALDRLVAQVGIQSPSADA